MYFLGEVTRVPVIYYVGISRVQKALMSSIQVFAVTVCFVDFTSYSNGYDDFIGKNLLLCLKKLVKKTAILNYGFNIKAIHNHNRGSVYCFWQYNWHAAM